MPKVTRIAVQLVKFGLLMGCLYLFICDLTLLTDAFRLIAGSDAAAVLRNSELFNNPIASLMVGVLVTVLLQSSSTTTSIIVSMTAAGLINVRQASFMIMGANIGTSVTSTIVALGQAGDRDMFRRAFASATVHDMFNWLTVLVMLPLEWATGFLDKFATRVVEEDPTQDANAKQDILKKITKPFTDLIVQVDTKLIQKMSEETNKTKLDALKLNSLLKSGGSPYLFQHSNTVLTDNGTGWVLLFLTLLTMSIMLFLMTKLLANFMKGRVGVWLHKSVNGNIPSPTCGRFQIPDLIMKEVTGYCAMLFGAALTMVVQSSSVTTSTLTPLVGLGVITLERCYPLVVGANLGTTITAILTALATDGAYINLALSVAYSHLFFNIFGTIIWYSVWIFRRLPIALAMYLGNITATYRWFAGAYLVGMYLIMPGIFLGLSIAGWQCLLGFGCVFLITCIFIGVVNFVGNRWPKKLPEALLHWTFVPKPLKSLEPWDRVMSKLCFCKKCKRPTLEEEVAEEHKLQEQQHAYEVAMDVANPQHFRHSTHAAPALVIAPLSAESSPRASSTAGSRTSLL